MHDYKILMHSQFQKKDTLPFWSPYQNDVFFSILFYLPATFVLINIKTEENTTNYVL